MRKIERNNERGSAIIIALFVLILLTAAGIAFVSKSKVETQVAANGVRATQAFFNAESGWAEALARLNEVEAKGQLISPAWGAWKKYPGWGVYVVSSNGASSADPEYAGTEKDGLDNNLNGTVDEAGEHYPEVLSAQGSQAQYAWVKVRYKLDSAKKLLLFGDHDASSTTPPQENSLNGVPVAVVTSSGQKGKANQTVQVQAVKLPLLSALGAFYLEQASSMVIGNQPIMKKNKIKKSMKKYGEVFLSGVDEDPVTGDDLVGWPGAPGVAITPSVGAITYIDTVAILPGNGGADVQQAPVPLDMDALANEITSYVDINLTPGTYQDVTWGTWDDVKIVYCPGDLTTKKTVRGAGVLVVDGDFRPRGTFEWDGLVLVKGELLFGPKVWSKSGKKPVDDVSKGDFQFTVYGAVVNKGLPTTKCIVGDARTQTKSIKLVYKWTIHMMYSSEAISRLSRWKPSTMAGWRQV